MCTQSNHDKNQNLLGTTGKEVGHLYRKTWLDMCTQSNQDKNQNLPGMAGSCHWTQEKIYSTDKPHKLTQPQRHLRHSSIGP